MLAARGGQLPPHLRPGISLLRGLNGEQYALWMGGLNALAQPVAEKTAWYPPRGTKPCGLTTRSLRSQLCSSLLACPLLPALAAPCAGCSLRSLLPALAAPCARCLPRLAPLLERRACEGSVWVGLQGQEVGASSSRQAS